MYERAGFLNIVVGIMVAAILISIVRTASFAVKSNSAQLLTADISQKTTVSFPAISTKDLLISTKEITRGDTGKKDVIFTFDGGNTTQSADKVLEALAKHHIKGTFFLTGKMIEAYPDLVKKIAAQGHEIFCHTYDHPDLTKISDDAITDELEKTEKALLAVADISPKPYFRAPYGTRNDKVLAVAARAGYTSVYWTVDALDWMGPKIKTQSQVKERILSRLAPGNIYLMHLGDTITGAVLDSVFTTIEARGYRIVSLTQGI